MQEKRASNLPTCKRVSFPSRFKKWFLKKNQITFVIAYIKSLFLTLEVNEMDFNEEILYNFGLEFYDSFYAF